MDPFSLSVGAIGITQTTLSSISKLRDILNGLEEANDILQDVTFELEAIHHPLSALENLHVSDEPTFLAAKRDLERTGVADAVNKCGQACDKFSKKLDKWTKHSNPTEVSLRDRLSVGLWNREKIRTFRTQVHSCQSIVQFAIDSAQLYVAKLDTREDMLILRRIILVRSESASKAARHETKKQLQVLETAIQKHVELTTKQQAEVLQRRRDLQSLDDEDDEDDGQRLLTIQETKAQSHFLAADQAACEVVSQILSTLAVPRVSTYNTNFSHSHNEGIKIGHNTSTITWNSGRT
ncbi:hypothetical protein N7508_000964 [Penicillium antarcticum]|uniref:uncharacterized protein n=1 Tax=Penicillium antarcticum TaxID=416450 RepID=UPI00238A4118|nr:uncharacterized protein N7508_000964 [Penicillium antarcticum]KAJ5320681.1 hypothetical protein N7508_000964 [Penicillium antarcticum]